MSYNLLNEYKSIKSKDLCLYDSNQGYIVSFKEGDLKGWDIAINIEGAGSVGPFFYGISSTEEVYFTRQFDFSPSFEAEFFWRFEVDML